MSEFATIDEFKSFRKDCERKLKAQEKKILVCGGAGCIASGSGEIYKEFIRLCKEHGLNVQVSLENHVEHPIGIKKTGCNGFCEMGPLVRIEPHGWLYTKVKLENCAEIIEKSVLNDELIEKLVYGHNKDYAVQEEIPFYKKQTRIVFENCGHIDAEDIREYVAKGGYRALEKALTEMTAEV